MSMRRVALQCGPQPRPAEARKRAPQAAPESKPYFVILSEANRQTSEWQNGKNCDPHNALESYYSLFANSAADWDEKLPDKTPVPLVGKADGPAADCW